MFFDFSFIVVNDPICFYQFHLNLFKLSSVLFNGVNLLIFRLYFFLKFWDLFFQQGNLMLIFFSLLVEACDWILALSEWFFLWIFTPRILWLIGRNGVLHWLVLDIGRTVIINRVFRVPIILRMVFLTFLMI